MSNNKSEITNESIKAIFSDGMSPNGSDFASLIDYVDQVSNGKKIKFSEADLPITLSNKMVQKFIITDIPRDSQLTKIALFKNDLTKSVLITGYLNSFQTGTFERFTYQWYSQGMDNGQNLQEFGNIFSDLFELKNDGLTLTANRIDDADYSLTIEFTLMD